MDDLEDVYCLMGKFQNEFNKKIEEGSGTGKYLGSAESENYYGNYQIYAPSGGRLVVGINLFISDGIATVKEDIGLKIDIFPKYCTGVPPFHIDIDSHRSSKKGRIIHINDAYGKHYDIPSETIDELLPKNVIDLVKISSQTICKTAIQKSFQKWNKK